MGNTAPLCSTQVEVSELTAKLLAMQQQVCTVTYHFSIERERERESEREGGEKRER